MRVSSKRKSVYFTIGAWRERGAIHIASSDPGVKNIHVTVNADPARVNGHVTLYKQLDALLTRIEGAQS